MFCILSDKDLSHSKQEMTTKYILFTTTTQTCINKYGEFVSLHRYPDICFAQQNLFCDPDLTLHFKQCSNLVQLCLTIFLYDASNPTKLIN